MPEREEPMRPLRVLLVTHGYPPASVGGVEQHVEGLARALLAAGHRVTIYTRTAAGGEEGGVQRAGRAPEIATVTYRHSDVRDFGGLYRSARLDAAFAAFLAEVGPLDVAHVHHLTGLSVGVLDALHAAAIPTVLTLHDYWLMCPRGQMWHRRGELCESVEVRRCAECLSVPFGPLLGASPEQQVAGLHAQARRLLALPRALVVPSARAIPPFAALGIDPAAIRVVENAVDTTALAAVPPLGRRARGQPLRVGYLGTLLPSKGLDVLVAACQSLPPGAVELHVFGNAVPYHGDEGFLTRVCQSLRPEDRFTYHGPYRTGDLPRILAGLDCVAAPARWAEAYGLTPREALAAGRPVVVSRVGGLQDAVRDGVDGMLVPPGDVAALAQALGRLAVEPDLAARLGEAGRGRPRGFPALAGELVDLYRGVANLDPPVAPG